MKPLVSLFIIGGLFLSACEEDPVIQVPGFQSKPVVNCIIDTRDSLHLIRLGRLFSGAVPPAETARIADSIYFSDARITATLVPIFGVGASLEAETLRLEKDPGYFNSGDYVVYSLYKKLIMGDYPGFLRYSILKMEVEIPDLPPAKCSTYLVNPPRIYSPVRAQQFVFIYPDNPIRIQWYGGDWNEIDVTFNVCEQFEDTTLIQAIHYQKDTDIIINEENASTRYCELKIPYDLLVQLLTQHLVYRTDLIRRYFGPVDIFINTGNRDFEVFKRYINGVNDFNFNPYNNIENGVGILSSKSTTSKTGLHLDDMSRAKLASEPKLLKYRFIEY